jgi:hypothetical protein
LQDESVYWPFNLATHGQFGCRVNIILHSYTLASMPHSPGIRCYSMAHFKSTGVCLLILSLNLLNTMIYLRIVIYEDLFEHIHVDLLMHVDLFPKICQNLFRSPERERHNKSCYLVRGWRQTPSCLSGWKTPNPRKLQD